MWWEAGNFLCDATHQVPNSLVELFEQKPPGAYYLSSFNGFNPMDLGRSLKIPNEETFETAEDQESYDDLLPLYNISSWGADYTVEVLVGKLKKDDIFIPPFQRKFVWTLSDASRFIESLIFGLPVPGVFL
jgi:hypothetical protein